jgi:hypothetical protein
VGFCCLFGSCAFACAWYSLVVLTYAGYLKLWCCRCLVLDCALHALVQRDDLCGSLPVLVPGVISLWGLCALHNLVMGCWIVIIECASWVFVILTNRISISFLVVLEICCMRVDWKDNNNFRAKKIIMVISLSKGYMRDYASCCLCLDVLVSLDLCLADHTILVYLCCLCWFLVCVGLSCSICAILFCWLSWMPIWDDRNNLRTKLYNLISGGPKVNKYGNNLFWGLYAQNKP